MRIFGIIMKVLLSRGTVSLPFYLQPCELWAFSGVWRLYLIYVSSFEAFRFAFHA